MDLSPRKRFRRSVGNSPRALYTQSGSTWANDARTRRDATAPAITTARIAIALKRPGLKGFATDAIRTINSRGSSNVASELINYARTGGSGFRGLADAMGLGAVADAIEYLLGRRRGSSSVPESAIAQAVQLLQNAGYVITPPGQPPAPPRSRTTSAPPPADGGIPGGAGTSTPGNTGQTGPSGMPTGTFPGRQYVGMRHVLSSNVYAIGYNPDTQTMRVQYLASWLNAAGLRGRGHRGKGRVRGTPGATVSSYRSGPGPTYDYYGVPERVFNMIDSSASKGRAIWDQLRIRGTVYGHKFDYALVGAAMTPVMDSLTRKPIAKVTYVPRRATGPGAFRPRVFKQGQGTFRSLLPRQ